MSVGRAKCIVSKLSSVTQLLSVETYGKLGLYATLLWVIHMSSVQEVYPPTIMGAVFKRREMWSFAETRDEQCGATRLLVAPGGSVPTTILVT